MAESKPNSKINLILLVIILIVAGGFLYFTKFRPLSDDEVRAIILKRANAAASANLRGSPMHSDAGPTVDVSIANLKLSNDTPGAHLPKVVEISGDLRATDAKAGAGTIKGTYNTATQVMHLELQFGGETHDLDNEFGSDRD